jgi:cysteinyl-tRNA synthetase
MTAGGGLVSRLRALWREYKSFGRLELETLQQQNAKLAAQLASVKARRQEQEAQEQVVLNGLRELVAEAQTVKSAVKEDENTVSAAVETLVSVAEAELARSALRAAAERLEAMPELAARVFREAETQEVESRERRAEKPETS